MNADSEALIGLVSILILIVLGIATAVKTRTRNADSKKAQNTLDSSTPNSALERAPSKAEGVPANRAPLVESPKSRAGLSAVESAGPARATGLADPATVSPIAPENRLIFLCYRRDDTQDAAGRLHDRLADAYGAESIFMDIDSVPLGLDFVDHVAEQIGRCSAVIVMIGRQWLTVQDKRGRRRLESENDLVRTEVAAALQQKIPVIPILVQDAEMPGSDELPEVIRSLARRNGIEISATRWKTDVDRLIRELDRVMKP